MKKISPHKRIIQRSMILLALLIFVGFGASVVSLVKIQLINSEKYKLAAQSNQLRDTVLTARRGTIYDANMQILARSASAWKVFLVPYALGEEGEGEEVLATIAERLSSLLDVSEKSIYNKAANRNYSYMIIKRGVETDAKRKVDEFLDEYWTETVDGEEQKHFYSEYIGIDPDVKRYYPYSNFASTLLGFTGADDIGRSGLELKYDSVLTGVPGRIVTAQNADGGASTDFETVYDAEPGTSLVLTIDEVIQRYLESSLEQAYIDAQAASATGIVMDVDTGAILAMTTIEGFDPNKPYDLSEEMEAKIAAIEDAEQRARALEHEQYRQWANRAVTDTYEPGSVFKIVTASAAIEENSFSLTRSFTCTGSIRVANRIISCHNHSGHGTQTLTQGLMNSCNPFFITVGQSLGTDNFFKYFEAFGFTEKTGIDLPSEAEPKEGTTYHALEDMGIVELSSSSFGQSFEVSPIQIITATACIANGGKLMQPYVVAKQLDDDGNIVRVTQPTVRRQVVSESTAQTVAEMMEKVVSNGTGKNAYVAGYRVAGKTGTSEKLGKAGAYVASFSCFAPANDPKIAVLIAIDEPVGQINGGQIATPVAAQVIENSLIYLNVEPQYTDEELSLIDTMAPQFVGMAADRAADEAENAGFSVRIMGDGDSVISQIPAYNQALPQNGVVILYTEDSTDAKLTEVPDFTGMTITEANRRATAAGLNIKISGNFLKRSELTAFAQSADPGAQAEFGKIITVYFKSDTGVSDLTSH